MEKNILKRKLWIILILSGLALIGMTLPGLAGFSNRETAQAAPLPAPVAQTDNQACLACHAEPGMRMSLPSGETLYLSVDPEIFGSSIHGQGGYACTQCHTEITGYPHPPLEAQDRRDVTLMMNSACARCHSGYAGAADDDAHRLALEQGNKQAAVCTDCHGAHDITDPDEPRSRIPQTCQRCHSQIFNLYKESVHGSDLIGAGNPDVPSCVDCHNAHNVQGPTNTSFRLFSPQICARCHANDTLMEKYGVNTNVFETYLSDFHGTTITLFQDLAPGQEPNKPVCSDCHGVHDIRRADDPNSTVIKENLLGTCQRCHPNADTNFPTAWLGHYQPNATRHPLVYYVNLFYQIFIPAVLGGMALLIVSDIGRRLFRRGKDVGHDTPPPPETTSRGKDTGHE